MKNKMNFPLMLGIIFIAFNLRAAITSVGPLVSLIRQDLVISNLVAGFITTIPCCFLRWFCCFQRLVVYWGYETGSFVRFIF